MKTFNKQEIALSSKESLERELTEAMTLIAHKYKDRTFTLEVYANKGLIKHVKVL